MRCPIILGLFLATTLAHAHGPAPAALGTPSPGLAIVRTNIGLAVQRPAGDYRYVCPATWDSDEQFPEAAVLSDGRIVIAFREAVYVLPADGCGRSVAALPDAGGATAILADGDRALVATRDAEGSRIWAVDGHAEPVVIARLDGFVDSLARTPDGAVVAAAARPEAQLIDVSAGAETRLPFAASFIALRGGGRFLRASTDQGVVLLEADGERWIERARAERSIHGPVAFEGGWIVVIDGWLHQRDGQDGELIAVAESDWTCLERRGDTVFTCVDFGLARVGQDLAAEPVFALSDIVGVDCPADPETHARCEGQWLHFGAEAGLVTLPIPPAEPEPTAPPAATSDDDCATRPGPGGGGWLLIFLPLVLRRRIATLRPTAHRGQSRSTHVQVPDSGRGDRRCRSDRL